MPGGSREVGAKGGRTAIENSGAFRVTVRKEQKKKVEKKFEKKKRLEIRRRLPGLARPFRQCFDVLKKRKKEEQLAPLNF